MFKGLGKFSLLLAGAALLVSSCAGQGPIGTSNAEVAAAAPTLTMDDVFLNYQDTQALVGVAKRNSGIATVQRALSASGKPLHWDQAYGLYINNGSTVRVLVVPAGPEVTSFVLLEDRGALRRNVVSAGLVRRFADGEAVLSQLGEGMVYRVKAGKILDWGPIQGTANLEELTSYDPSASHHPEIPADPHPCSYTPGRAADPCVDEQATYDRASKAFQQAKNAFDGRFRSNEFFAPAFESFLGITGAEGATTLLGCQWQLNLQDLVCKTTIDAAGARYSYIKAQQAIGVFKDLGADLTGKQVLLDRAKKALDDCRRRNPPPDGGVCVSPPVPELNPNGADDPTDDDEWIDVEFPPLPDEDLLAAAGLVALSIAWWLIVPPVLKPIALIIKTEEGQTSTLAPNCCLEYLDFVARATPSQDGGSA